MRKQPQSGKLTDIMESAYSFSVFCLPVWSLAGSIIGLSQTFFENMGKGW